MQYEVDCPDSGDSDVIDPVPESEDELACDDELPVCEEDYVENNDDIGEAESSDDTQTGIRAFIPYVLALLVILLLIGVVIYLLMRRKNKAQQEDEPQ
jgi:virulence-associated protein VagC